MPRINTSALTMTSSLAAHVFNIPEVPENILVHLQTPSKTIELSVGLAGLRLFPGIEHYLQPLFLLFALKRVHNTSNVPIERSQACRQLMCLKPASASDPLRNQRDMVGQLIEDLGWVTSSVEGQTAPMRRDDAQVWITKEYLEAATTSFAKTQGWLEEDKMDRDQRGRWHQERRSKIVDWQTVRDALC